MEKIYIPDNEYEIAEGYYDWSGLVRLLRKFKNNPDAVQFIADMME